jgi:hypothetical protein
MASPNILAWKAVGSAVTGTTVSVTGNNINGTATRTTGDRATDIVNVKDFGAQGDGVTDDTVAIQAAITAAFGPSSAANGEANKLRNKELYFPGGKYMVNAPTAMTVSAAAASSGKIQITVGSIPSFGTSSQAYKTGYLCNFTLPGVTDGGTAVSSRNYGITVENATTVTLEDTVYGGALSSTGSGARAALQFVNIDGGVVRGAGRGTQIVTAANTASVVAVNGFARSVMSDIEISGAGGSANICLDLDWDRVQVSCQGNTFANMSFRDSGYGARLGNHGQQVSENTFFNCSWSEHDVAGVSIQNYNALQMAVIGGNMQNCGVAIYVVAGSCPIIQNVGFQNGSGIDIKVDNSANDSYVITGCRSESNNFAEIHAGPGVHLSGCTMTSASTGILMFYEDGTGCIIDTCESVNGSISQFSNGKFWIRGGVFGSTSFIPASMGATARIMQYDLGPIPVASLPTAAAHFQGLRQSVTNASTAVTTFGSAVVASTGTGVPLPVWCSSTAWLIG